MGCCWNSLAMAVPLVLAGCLSTPVDLDAERARLVELDREWDAALLASEDVDAMVFHLAQDACVLPLGSQAIWGKPALREFVSAALAREATDAGAQDGVRFEPAFPVHCEVLDIRFSDDGTQACMVQTNVLVITNHGGAVSVEHGQGTKVWRKQSDGTWKCSVHAWSRSGQSSLGY
jgi:ketosteroid isomerase-like protein